MSGEHRAQHKAHPLIWEGLEKIAYGPFSDVLGSPEMLLLQMRCRIEALESGRADHPEPIMLTDDERETALTKMAEKPGGNIAASCVREMLCRIKALEANHFTAAELRARIEALEAAQHAHADLSRLSDAEREQVMRTAGFAYAESAEQRHVTPEAKPAPSLDQMIIDAMLAAHVKGGGTSFPVPHPDEIQAAIRAVAAWLRTGRLLHAAELLGQEADRG